MCGPHPSESPPNKLQDNPSSSTNAQTEEPFPWELGVYDAHCHPTDTNAISMPRLPGMNTRAFVIMATRLQDQLLVEIASRTGVRGRADVFPRTAPRAGPGSARAAKKDEPESDDEVRKVIPSYGWHPWFTYQMYDDVTPMPDKPQPPMPVNNYSKESEKAMKIFQEAHYRAVLHPYPKTEDALLTLINSLPPPLSLSEYLKETRRRLAANPIALVGEIGLDRAFRLPEPWTPPTPRDELLMPGGRPARKLSATKVRPQHQIAILRTQIRLAAEMGRAVSVHGVQCHGLLYDILSEFWAGFELPVEKKKDSKKGSAGTDFTQKDTAESSTKQEINPTPTFTQTIPFHPRLQKWNKPYPPRICLHSFTGPPELVPRYFRPEIPCKIYMSFSMAVNLLYDPPPPFVGMEVDDDMTTSSGSKLRELIRLVPEDRILVESDAHLAGKKMDRAIEVITRYICDIKGWELRAGVEKLGKNFEAFVFG